MPQITRPTRLRATSRAGFSLIELVIVVVIIGIIGAIAIPRMSSAAESAAKSAVIADQTMLQKAVDMYTAEHGGMMPHAGIGADMRIFYRRLFKKSDSNGTLNASGIYGPYINGIPTNRINGITEIRIDGAAPGANTHGWRYDSMSGLIEPDHLEGTGTFDTDSNTVEVDTGNMIDGLGG